MAACVAAMVVLGGVVRLSRAGLSIVAWDPVVGALPPLTEGAWAEAFAAYQRTPEYLLANAGLSAEGFRSLFWLEYAHRLLGRVAGLVFAVPLAVALVRGWFPPRLLLPLAGIGALFAAQATVGWLMVASGLIDQPWVSPHRLALHLLLALALLAPLLWLLCDRVAGERPPGAAALRAPARALLAATIVQMGVGALVAGYRAGLISNTFPLIHGQWLPEGLRAHDSLLGDLLGNAVTIHFEHRWFAFAVAGLALWLLARSRRPGTPPGAQRLAAAAVILVAAQIGLGIAVVLAGLPAWLASLHQAAGLGLFAVAVVAVHRVRGAARPAAVPG